MKDNKKYIICTDDALLYLERNKKEIEDALKEENIELTEENLINEAQFYCELDIDNLKYYVNKIDAKYNSKILVVACLGLWYGKRNAKKVFNSLDDCVFNFCEDYNTFYFERINTTLTLQAIHHDGCNIFKFYRLNEKGQKRAITLNDIME